MALNGIDVSSAQAGMDVTKVNADFVIVKATQGTTYVNPYCDKHYQQGKQAGKLRGVYHYANGGNAVNEADFFLKNIQGYIKDAILALDWEKNIGGGQVNPIFGTAGAPAWIKTWCDHVYQETGVKPLVYIQQGDIWQTKGIGDYGLWVAQYADHSVTKYQENPWNEGKYACAIRQYAGDGGRVDGYSGAVDLDKFYGDKAAWQKYANPSGQAQPVKPAQQPATKPALATQPQAQPVSTGIKVGDTVTPKSLVDYNGHALKSYHNAYTVTQINGDRAVLSVGGQVWAAMRVSNLNKVGGTPAPAPRQDTSIHVGDNVRVVSAVTYNGTPFKLYYSTYKVMELKGDRAVIGVNGQVTAAIRVGNLRKA